jgi:hypothetical protein
MKPVKNVVAATLQINHLLLLANAGNVKEVLNKTKAEPVHLITQIITQLVIRA